MSQAIPTTITLAVVRQVLPQVGDARMLGGSPFFTVVSSLEKTTGASMQSDFQFSKSVCQNGRVIY